MVKDYVYGLNHQVNPAELVQIKLKHEIWKVQKYTSRSQVQVIAVLINN